MPTLEWISLKTSKSTLVPEDNHMELLINVLRNNCRKLQSLLRNNHCDVNHIYGAPFEKPVLEIACFELAWQTRPRCIKVLLQHGASAENALISAALGGNPRILGVILKHLGKTDIDITSNTVLLSLLHYIHNEDKDEATYVANVKLLLQHGVDVNVTESRSTCTAIYRAAECNLPQTIAAILTTSFETVDLDGFIDKEFGSARDLIIMRKLYDGVLPAPIYHDTQEIRTDLITLVQYIKRRKEMNFIAQHRKMKAEHRVDHRADYVLLLCATEEGCLTVVRYLLCIGVDPNACNSWNKLPPIRLAVVRGYYRILEILVQYSSSWHISDSFVSLLQGVCLDHECMETMQINHRKCFELLLRSDKLDVNFRKGELSEVALHFAIRNQTPDVVIKILRKGASLALLRLSNRPWTVFVSPEVLQTHLNECISISRVNEFTNEFTLIINFATLLPVRNVSFASETCNKDDYFETEPFLADKKVEPNQALSETKVLEYICNKPEYALVLHHPVIYIFLHLRWLHVRRFFIINFVVYLVFVAALLTYIFLGYNHVRGTASKTSLYYCSRVLATLLMVLFARELVQMYIYRGEYLKNYENYLELACLLTTAFILHVEFDNKMLFNQLAALVIVLSTIELLLMSGRHTQILFTSITMLTTVSLTFLKLLLPYFTVVIAFAISFFILFQDGKHDAEAEPKESNFFSIIWMSLLKTVVMLTGEFEAGNLDFMTYPYASTFLFVLFVFHMNIVLFGVFTALAISDTQKIKAEAETQSQIFRIKHICYWEKVLRVHRIMGKLPVLKRIMRTHAQIEIYLTKDAKLYTKNVADGTRTEIKLHKKITSAVKALILKKNDSSGPCFKKCPILRYPNLNDRDYYVIHKEILENNAQ